MDTNILNTFFKGFVVTQNKKCIEKFKGRTSFKSYDEVKELPEFAGILAEDAVVFDFDDPEQAECAFNIVKGLDLKCAVIKTTRGKHILLKNDGEIKSNKIHTRLACGLTCDIKVGCKNSYAILKYDNKERTVERNITEGEEYQTEPVFFSPIKISKTEEGNWNIWNLSEGEGRNQALYNYILKLQDYFSVDEIRDIYRTVINPYVLKEPLSDDELDVILRDESFQKVSEKKGFSFSDFGDRMIHDFNMKRINDQLHIYRDGIYISNVRYIENAMLQINKINAAKRNEVLKYLDITILDDTSTLYSDDYIAFQNGVLDLTDGTMKPFSPAYIILNKIPWNYDPTAYDKATDEMLDRITCRNKDIRALLEEMTGYCFYRSDKYRKSFILTGKGKNGKSTFLKMLRFALDKYSNNNVSSLSLQNLGDRFSTVQLYEKLANIGDDIPNSEFSGFGLSIFKKVVSGETLKAEYKGKDAFNMKPYAKQIFAANRMPNFKASDLVAIRDRLIIIPFNARFDKSEGKEFNPNIMADLMKQPAIEYLIRLGVEGLKRVIGNQGFTEADASEKELDEFELDNDSILSWIDSLKSSDDESLHDTVDTWIVGRTFDDIYDKYQGYCIREGIREVIAGRNFSKELCNRVDGLMKSRLNDKKRSITYKWYLTR